MDLNSVLDDIERDVNESMSLPGMDHVSLDDMFPDPFIAENTEFESMESLVESYCENSDTDQPLGPELDDFIQAHSDFGSWNNMRQQAEIKFMEEHLA